MTLSAQVRRCELCFLAYASTSGLVAICGVDDLRHLAASHTVGQASQQPAVTLTCGGPWRDVGVAGWRRSDPYGVCIGQA